MRPLKIPEFMKLFSFLLLIILAACSATEPSPFDSDEKPTLLYKPDTLYQKQLKYPVTLGVLNVRDVRHLKFYGYEDGYFTEEIPAAVSNMLFSEMKLSGIFKKVIKINEVPPQELTQKYFNELRKKYNIDMILATQLTRFNMLRNKEGSSFIHTFKITVDIGFISQLIYLKNGFVVWSDSVDRQDKELAKDGALEPAKLKQLTNNAMKSAIGDVKVLVLKTGKVMRKK